MRQTVKDNIRQWAKLIGNLLMVLVVFGLLYAFLIAGYILDLPM